MSGVSAPDEKHHLPSEPPDDCGRDPAGTRRAKRKPAEHRHDDRGSRSLRHVLGRQGDRVGHRPSHPEPREDAKRRESRDRRRRRGQERAQAEGQHARDEHGLAPDAVGERAEGERAEHHAERPARDDGAERDTRDMEFGAQRGGDEPHDLGVEPVEEHDCRAEAGNQNMEAAERLLIEESTDVERGRAWQGEGKYIKSLRRRLGLVALERVTMVAIVLTGLVERPTRTGVTEHARLAGAPRVIRFGRGRCMHENQCQCGRRGEKHSQGQARHALMIRQRNHVSAAASHAA